MRPSSEGFVTVYQTTLRDAQDTLAALYDVLKEQCIEIEDVRSFDHKQMHELALLVFAYSQGLSLVLLRPMLDEETIRACDARLDDALALDHLRILVAAIEEQFWPERVDAD